MYSRQQMAQFKRALVTAVVSVTIVAVVAALILWLYVPFTPPYTPAAVPEEMYYINYLEFLKEHTAEEWHSIWEQMWRGDEIVRIPATITSLYDTRQDAADAVLEHIRAYVFWADLPVDERLTIRFNLTDVELVGFEYYVNSDEVVMAVDAALSSALWLVMQESEPLRRVVLIERYLRQNVSYGDWEPQEGQTIHSAMVRNVAVCAGYAYSFNTLALLAGLDSHIVTGYTVTKQEDGTYLRVRHAWNMVNVDGIDYITDVTTNATSRTRHIVNVPADEIDTDFYVEIEGIYVPAVCLRNKM